MKKTVNDLHILGRTDPTVNNYLKLLEMKELSLEEALIGMVFTLTDIKNQATENYVNHLQKCTTPYIEKNR